MKGLQRRLGHSLCFSASSVAYLAAQACCLAITLFSPAHADITVRDDTGQVLHFTQAPKRIISLAPHATELLFEIGAGKRIVGAVAYSDYPEAAQRILHRFLCLEILDYWPASLLRAA